MVAPAVAVAGIKAAGALLGGDARSSSDLQQSASSRFDAGGFGVSTGGDALPLRWMPWALAGVGVVALLVVLRRE